MTLPDGAANRGSTGAADGGPDRPVLARRLGLRDAVLLGLGSMVGAGIFAAVSPAALAAGRRLPLAVVLAGGIAWLNAMSSGRLAAVHPQAGGSYAYATARLGRRWGHLAGWSFVVGKIASCAAMAYTVGAYAVPGHARWAALAALFVVALLGTGGIQRGARLTRVTLAIAAVALLLVVGTAWFGPAPEVRDPVGGWSCSGGGSCGYGVLQAAGLMFFAFAGYARVATLGEEVREPSRTIPRAIGLALALTVALYLIVVLSALHAVGPAGLAARTDPLVALVSGLPGGRAEVVVRVGAVAASAGALLGLLLGVSRVLFAMARDGHLPRGLTQVRRGVPDRAEWFVAVVVAGLVVVGDLRHVIGFSSMTVLTYYAVTHLAAWQLRPDEGRPASVVLLLGVAGCVVLALTLPLLSVLGGVVVLGAGVVAGWRTTRRFTASSPSQPSSASAG